MRCVALTGGIATGKSTVASLLAQRGAAIVDADVIARDVVAVGEPALEEIERAFGSSVIALDGALDREALATLVFADRAQRRKLEAITHPRIREVMRSQVAEAMTGDSPLVVVDIPLLFESGLHDEFPDSLLVYATPHQQRERLAAREGLDDDAITARLASQLPIDDKRAHATWIIDNDGTLEDLEGAVAEWWTNVVRDAATSA